MATNELGFTDKAERDAEWNKLREAGVKGVTRYSTHVDNKPQIVYVLTQPVVPAEVQTEVPLTEAITSGMLDAGGNTDEQTNILATQTQADTADATEPTSEG